MSAQETVPPPPETIEVTEPVVACDGGKLGHPRVWLNLEAKGYVDCPYCDRRFVLAKGGGRESGEAAPS